MQKVNIKIYFIYVLVVLSTTKTFAFQQDSLVNHYRTELKTNSNQQKKAELYYQLAEVFSNQNQADSALRHYKNALKLNTALQQKDKVADCNLAIFSLLDSQNQLETEALPYLDKYYSYAKASKDNKRLLEAKLSYASYYFNPQNYKTSRAYYLEAITEAKQLKDTLSEAKIYGNLGLLYSGYISQDSARTYFNEALKIYNETHPNQLFSTYFNYANSFQKEEKYNEAIAYLKRAEQLEVTQYRNNYFKALYGKLTICYKHLDDYKNAYSYFEKYNTIKDSINVTSQNIAISKIKEEYDNEKLRADNLESEANRKQNRNIAFSLAGILILGGFIGFLIQRNTKRKQLLAEKGKALETQKLATVLKEQELKSIDAMIAGQEKERQRIANDLHDDLGSLMANVKLHFDALKDNPSPELYTKANSLIENAYDKIRGIAHAKNSGVMANKGLLKAINDIANSNSITNKLHIQVVDYGLEQQLENSLELTIFRIIQELIANIIKHAEATEATIHITNHDDAINLMIEDNGKGFDTKTISKQKGMGIHSIDKRIESLGGTITIESEINKGTTVIIDIPTL